MKVSLGCDHGAYELKEWLKGELEKAGYECVDFGTYSAESCNYPEFAEAAARAVADGRCQRGIVLCTTGIGASITANKVKGIRCALCGDTWSAEMTRRHNNSNVLALGAGIVGKNLAWQIVEKWLGTGFDGGRHAVRVNMITEIENKQ